MSKYRTDEQIMDAAIKDFRRAVKQVKNCGVVLVYEIPDEDVMGRVTLHCTDEQAQELLLGALDPEIVDEEVPFENLTH